MLPLSWVQVMVILVIYLQKPSDHISSTMSLSKLHWLIHLWCSQHVDWYKWVGWDWRIVSGQQQSWAGQSELDQMGIHKCVLHSGSEHAPRCGRLQGNQWLFPCLDWYHWIEWNETHSGGWTQSARTVWMMLVHDSLLWVIIALHLQLTFGFGYSTFDFGCRYSSMMQCFGCTPRNEKRSRSPWCLMLLKIHTDACIKIQSFYECIVCTYLYKKLYCWTCWYNPGQVWCVLYMCHPWC